MIIPQCPPDWVKTTNACLRERRFAGDGCREQARSLLRDARILSRDPDLLKKIPSAAAAYGYMAWVVRKGEPRDD